MFEAGLICMALNVYFEARDQPLVGQIAVAETVLNRVHSTLFPDTVCEVVYQGEYYSWNPDIPVKIVAKNTSINVSTITRHAP